MTITVLICHLNRRNTTDLNAGQTLHPTGWVHWKKLLIN